MSNNWAFIVGINHYDHHPDQNLRFAVRDAELLRDFLCNHAQFPSEQVICCLSDEANRYTPTYPTCSTLLKWINRELHPDKIGQVDRIWFYFSGHGVSENGRDYLLAADTLQEDLQRFALPLDEVVAALRRHKQADVVLILDACRELQGQKKFNVLGEETVKLTREHGITTIFSCDYGQVSYELEALQHGAFTYALVEALKQHTLPTQLERYLQQRVAELNRAARQTPKIRLESASKAFHPLLPDRATSADITEIEKQAIQAEVEESFEEAKALWWQVIEIAPLQAQRSEARRAIERVDAKIARVKLFQTPNVFPAPSPSNSPPLQSESKQAPPPLESPQPPVQPKSSNPSFEFDIVTIDRVEKTGFLGMGTPKVITTTCRGRAEYFTEDLGAGVMLEMVIILGGTFRMGAPAGEAESYGDERPQHQVNVPSFWMGKFPVTQAQWKQVALLPQVERELNPGSANFKGADRPVAQVSWLEAVEFCARLSKATGREYRLPSEAEWEYACRARTTTPFHFGETITTDLANYNGNYTYSYGAAPKGVYRQETTPVGSFPPNAFGLYDMHGNVWEWCLDRCHKNYNNAPTKGEAWVEPSADGYVARVARIARGGSWYNAPRYCRSAYRDDSYARGSFPVVGFRVVCSAPRALS